MVLNKIHVSLVNPPQDIEISTERFEELFQIRYLQHLEFENWEAEQWIKNKSKKAEKRGRMGDLAIWLGHFHRKEIEEAKVPDLSIRWIDESIGYGLFTTRTFQPWEFIGEYTGLVRRRKRLRPNINDYCFMYPHEWFPTRAYTIDGNKQGNYTRFINHSDTPNCESVAVYHDGYLHIILRTIQEVPKGAQLTYDYGDIYWRRRKKI